MGILAGFWLRNGAFWARFAALWGVSDACASLFRQGLGGGSLTGGAWVRGEGGGRSCTLGRSGAQGAVRKSFRFIRAALRVICFLFAWEVRAVSLSLSLSCSLLFVIIGVCAARPPCGHFLTRATVREEVAAGRAGRAYPDGSLLLIKNGKKL